MQKIIAIVCLVLVLFLNIMQTHADPKLTIKTAYYLIRGNTDAELRYEMNQKSQIRQNGKSYDAHTSWQVRWRYTWKTTKSSCAIASVSTEIDVVFTLPKWVNDNTPNHVLKDKWRRYYKALIDHENGHKNFGIRAAKEIEEAILNMEPRKNCHMLERDANQIGHHILHKYSALEQQYDIHTNHGMNHGARFP